MYSCFSISYEGAADAPPSELAAGALLSAAAGLSVLVPPLLHAASAALPPSRPAAARKLRRGTRFCDARRRISSI